MKLYQDSGYVNIRGILGEKLPFNFVVGGRATGKTYTSLQTVVEDDIIFMYMRRTQAQADLINKPEFTPFKSLNRDRKWDIVSSPITKYNAGFYKGEDGKPVGEPIGYTCALSTISNTRGFDAQDVKLLIYDEFIPEKHERPIKNEGAAFLNAYETINRNRELNGNPPMQVICLANANDLSNPLFLELGIVRKAEQMRRKGQEISIDKKRGIGIFMLTESPISNAKRNTALYKLTSGSEFEKMSIENDFAERDYRNIIVRPLVEYRPIVAVGEICIYAHKSTNRLYVSTHRTGSPPTFTSGYADLRRFSRSYMWIWWEYMENKVEFEEILCEILLTKYYNL